MSNKIVLKVTRMQLSMKQYEQQRVLVEPENLFIEIETEQGQEMASPEDPDHEVLVLTLEELSTLHDEIDAVMLETTEVKKPKYATNVNDFS